MTYGREVLRRRSKEQYNGSVNAMPWREGRVHGCKDIDRPVGCKLKCCSEVDFNARREKVEKGFERR